MGVCVSDVPPVVISLFETWYRHSLHHFWFIVQTDTASRSSENSIHRPIENDHVLYSRDCKTLSAEAFWHKIFTLTLSLLLLQHICMYTVLWSHDMQVNRSSQTSRPSLGKIDSVLLESVVCVEQECVILNTAGVCKTTQSCRSPSVCDVCFSIRSGDTHSHRRPDEEEGRHSKSICLYCGVRLVVIVVLFIFWIIFYIFSFPVNFSYILCLFIVCFCHINLFFNFLILYFFPVK